MALKNGSGQTNTPSTAAAAIGSTTRKPANVGVAKPKVGDFDQILSKQEGTYEF